MKKIKLFFCVAAILTGQSLFAQVTKDTIKTTKPNDPMVIHPGRAHDPNAMLTDTGFITSNIIASVEAIALGKMALEKGHLARGKENCQIDCYRSD